MMLIANRNTHNHHDMGPCDKVTYYDLHEMHLEIILKMSVWYGK
jgi:hypothetical protein